MFFKKEPLAEHHSEFISSVLNGNISKLKEKLELCPALARYHHCGMPPVFSVVSATYKLEVKISILDLLKEYRADFKLTYYVDRCGKFFVNGLVNPIAWLLLNGGDTKLIDILVKHGTDIQHESVDYVKELICHYQLTREESRSRIVAKL